MSVKAVIFDLGGVYFTEGTGIAVERISKKYKITKESAEKSLHTGSEIGQLYRKGLISMSEFWKKSKKLWGIKTDNHKLNSIWVESYKPINGTVRIIKRLKKNGVKLYFLSDNVKERIEYLEGKYKFMRYFVGGIFSHEVHMTKREGTKIFRLALKMTKEKTENVLFVDDKEQYVETAREIGMNVIHFKSPMNLDRELKKLGLL